MAEIINAKELRLHLSEVVSAVRRADVSVKFLTQMGFAVVLNG